jgi:hypothetical protein
MSCDYRRWEYWRHFTRWYENEVPEPLQDIFEDILGEIFEDLLEDSTLSTSRRNTIRRRRVSSPVETAIESTYIKGQQEAKARQEKWTKPEREELAEKTKKVLRIIRTTGAPEGKDPVHSKTGLPRVSSQAGYAAVYDLFVELGIEVDTPFAPVYEVIEQKAEESREKWHTLTHRVEKVESLLRKGTDSEAIASQKVVLEIQTLDADVFNLLDGVIKQSKTEHITAGGRVLT